MPALLKVAIIDDSEDYRESVRDDFRDSPVGYEPLPLDGPFPTLESLVEAVVVGHDAAICDHELNSRNYALCSGAEAVGRLYDRRFPAVLVTQWGDAEIDQMRQYRRKIPVLLNPDQATPET